MGCYINSTFKLVDSSTSPPCIHSDRRSFPSSRHRFVLISSKFTASTTSLSFILDTAMNTNDFMMPQGNGDEWDNTVDLGLSSSQPWPQYQGAATQYQDPATQYQGAPTQYQAAEAPYHSPAAQYQSAAILFQATQTRYQGFPTQYQTVAAQSQSPETQYPGAVPQHQGPAWHYQGAAALPTNYDMFLPNGAGYMDCQPANAYALGQTPPHQVAHAPAGLHPGVLATGAGPVLMSAAMQPATSYRRAPASRPNGRDPPGKWTPNRQKARRPSKLTRTAAGP